MPETPPLTFVGQRQRPRVLVTGPDESEVFEDITALVPTVRNVGEEDLPLIRQKEWDVAVNMGEFDTAVFDPHLHVVAAGCARLGNILKDEKAIHLKSSGFAQYVMGSVATEFAVPNYLPPELKRLVQTDLLPLVQGRSMNADLTARFPHANVNLGRVVQLDQSELLDLVEPFLLDGDGKILAGRFKRNEDATETWFLPRGADVLAWLRCALREWSKSRPDLELGSGDWPSDTKWMTPDEMSGVELVLAADETLRSTSLRLEGELRQAEAALESLRSKASIGPRRLLTHQGEDLVAAVIAALCDLGFECREMDSVHDRGAKLEDLRVSDPEDADWLALAEVRGYARGAQVRDLMRIQRFVMNYIKDEGVEPPAKWYLVNSFIGDPPEGRDEPLASHPAELEEFAENGGLVIDTRQLFRLWRAAASGDMDLVTARSHLKATGRFLHPEGAK